MRIQKQGPQGPHKGDVMNGNIFLRTSVVFLCIGITLGLYMGGTHDFTQMPTHAHLNLVGGVLMFLGGLLAAADKRYRLARAAERKAVEIAAAAKVM